jgi:hypothetical protein
MPSWRARAFGRSWTRPVLREHRSQAYRAGLETAAVAFVNRRHQAAFGSTIGIPPRPHSVAGDAVLGTAGDARNRVVEGPVFDLPRPGTLGVHARAACVRRLVVTVFAVRSVAKHLGDADNAAGRTQANQAPSSRGISSASSAIAGPTDRSTRTGATSATIRTAHERQEADKECCLECGACQTHVQKPLADRRNAAITFAIHDESPPHAPTLRMRFYFAMKSLEVVG